MRLYPKIILFLVGVICVSLLAGLYLPSRAVHKALIKQIVESAAAAAPDHASEFFAALSSRREADGIKALYVYKNHAGAVSAGLLDRGYRVLAHTNVALAGSTANLAWNQMPAGRVGLRKTFSNGEEVAEAVIPLHVSPKPSAERILFEDDSTEPDGYLWVLLSLKPALNAEREIASGIILTAGSIAVFALLATGVFVRLQLRQINLLGEGIKKVREGNLEWRVPVESSDEVGDLSSFFNEMTEELFASRRLLEEYQKGLEKKVEERTRELESSQERLLQAGKMAAVGQLVSGVAHELNNPLAGIMGYAQLMLRDSGLGPQQREDLGVILSQAERAKEIIRHLLHFSRKGESKREPVSISGLVESSLKLLNYDFSSAGITLERSWPADLPPVMGDASQLQQVFLNIIGNARDAMAAEKRGTLRIAASAEGDKVFVRFTDTGPGITRENLDKIFDPFFTTKPTGKGTGLGLSISYEIIKRHKGLLSAEGGSGRGATFTIELPVKNEEL